MKTKNYSYSAPSKEDILEAWNYFSDNTSLTPCEESSLIQHVLNEFSSNEPNFDLETVVYNCARAF